MQVLRRLTECSAEELRLLAEAMLAIAAASLAIRLLPFRRAVRMASAPIGGGSLGDTERCIWAVNAAAARAPWKTVCFQKGLALQYLLRSRNIAAILHYGVAKDPQGRLMAHVWVEVDGRTVMGGEEAPGFQRVASYPEVAAS